MDLSFFQDAYRNKKYEEVVSHDAFMRESLNPRFLVILIKSLIHLFGEDDLRVRDNLFLFLYSEKSLSFR
jgi:hypothetical protein